MDWDWAALGVALRQRRLVLRLTQEELADLAEVHAGTVKNYEAGKRGYAKIPKGALQIEKALGWTPGSARAILAGGKPTLITAEAVEDSTPVRYEVEDDPDTEDVGMIVRNTVIEVVGVLAPDTPLSEVQEIEALALKAVLQRGRRPRQRHRQAFQDTEAIDSSAE